MIVYFARHGQGEAKARRAFANRGEGPGLTELGRQQAADLAGYLAAREVSRLFVSPLRRAVETARQVSRALGVPHEVREALREVDCGIYEDTSDPAGWEAYQTVWEDWRRGRPASRLPGGENLLQIRDRFLPFLDELRSLPEEPALAVIGHAGLFRCMLPLALENIDLAFAGDHSLGHGEVVAAERRGERFVALWWGAASLLPGDEEARCLS